MERLKMSKDVLRPLIVGILAGTLGIIAGALGIIYLDHLALSQYLKQSLPAQNDVGQIDWLREDFYDMPCQWCYLKVDENGWSAVYIKNLLHLKELINTAEREIVIPVFPTVYVPRNDDELYCNTILESNIKIGDKVLVVGAGSGSDAWVASMKSQSLVYVIEINPMAIANMKTTARLANFQVKPILGDIRDVNLPDDFTDFDFVLWNMPFLHPHEKGKKLAERNFHDGDEGSILTAFLKRLPSLLKKDGQAIVLNTVESLDYFDYPDLTTKGDGDVMIYIFSNPD